ncbi:MAG: hypothetical protein KGJ09_01775 [Candidatus Omnitrophica bacterium]|nr:hypothetical protein [Candidatus Omnitrophota bacterium]MDE2008787.1 hypothetical protein [Candidatus Omnitrophota bacterium]MDE2213650.1 hypothetical protein [Candidatus Omnitrophota bacterium]MDE2230449.1 hypothetical protein [Candidatus Omnitrophota bacterium]
MAVLYTILIISACVLVLLSAWRARLLSGGRRGKLPAKGRGTMFDVRHLLMEGEKELAIQLYCEIFQTTPLKAKKDVEELERSLKV